MVYLDYSATTFTDKEVLDTFIKCSNEYIGNPNSLHKLGVASKELIDASTLQIINLLKLDNSEIIYTSGSTESNNLALIGTCTMYPKRGKHIITSKIESWDESEVYPQAIIIIDLNNISYINDNYGREEGDKVITEAANILIMNQR